LASEYGWTKDYILDYVYPDEAIELSRRIRNRITQNNLMSLAISSNPWSDNPKALVRELESRIDEEMELGDEEPDHAALSRLKQKLGGSKQFRVQ
jgi:hypothetical protein